MKKHNRKLSTKIAYIVSGKTGMHSFTFKELELLEENNLDFTICFTQLNNGIYLPKNNWDIVVFNKYISFFYLMFYIFSNPKSFFSLINQSLKSDSFKYLLVAIFFSKIIKNITSIHCQMGDHKLFIAYYLSQICKLPLSVTIHAHELYSSLAYDYTNYFTRILNYCTKVFTISDFNKKYLIENFSIDEKKICVMRLYPAHMPDNYAENKVKFLVVGNWVRKKGYEFLFKAISEIDRDDIIFWIVGGNTHSIDSIDLKVLSQKFNIENKVKLLGYQKEDIVKILLEQCDIFCLTSITDYDKNGKVIEREGIPVALMEAIQFNKPIISTIHAGIPELVKQVLVQENNVEELKEAILYMVNNKSDWKLLVSKNREILEEKYTTKNISSLIDLFENLGNDKRSIQ